MKRNLKSIKEAAEYLDMTVYGLRKWVREGRIVFYRMGGRLKFDEADLEAFVESRRVPASDGVGRAVSDA